LQGKFYCNTIFLRWRQRLPARRRAEKTRAMNLESWKSQLRKGAAELAVLALLGRRDLSGIGLLDELSQGADIGLSDGSIYPLLSRLEREGRIAGDWRAPKGGGRGQKVYRLTADGRAALKQMSAGWTAFRDELSRILGD
jgi:PadR family transcriptional regulator PadR